MANDSNIDLQSVQLQPWDVAFVDPPGLGSNLVFALHASPDGSLWVGTGGGLSRFVPGTGQWQTYTTRDGLADDYIYALHASPDGSLWVGTSGGLSRFVPGTGQWQTYTTRDGLAADYIYALHASPDGSLWVGTSGGLNNIAIGSLERCRQGAVSSISFTHYLPTLAVGPSLYAHTRSAGLVVGTLNSPMLAPIACRNAVLALAYASEDGVWSGECLGGLHLYRLNGTELSLTESQGLPANHVSALATLPGQPHRLWVGTAGGAARVALAENALHIERAVTCEDGVPSGPINALVALADGAVFLAYNASASKWIVDPELAQRRASSQVRFIPSQGAPSAAIYCYRGSELLHTVSMRALAIRDETLWAATSGGLFKADQPRQPGTQLQLVTDPGSPQTPLRQLKTNPITGELWMIADAQEDVPVRLIGYDPSSNTSVSLGPENGIPSGLPIHDLDFTADGDLVVLVGARRFKGFVQVGESPLVAELKADPAKLRHIPLAHIPEALAQLRLARALEAVCRQLGLSDRRLGLLHTLAQEANLPALASLLGMDAPKVQAVEVQELRAGLRLFPARLSYPRQFQRQILPLLCAEAEVISTEDETACRNTIRHALDTLQHRFELPFVLLCQNTTLAHRLIPDGFSALVIDEAISRELFFASYPQQTFAGFLLTRGLLALSPYRTEGAVIDNSEMFYGRDRVVRELMQAPLPQCLLVGPRRVGKTSLLYRLQTQLSARRPDLQLFMLDLLGVKEAGRFASRLSRTLGLPASTPVLDPYKNAVQIEERLREKFADTARPGLIFVDEADSLIEADAAADFPLLAALRSLQAEGVCSFILTGYWYLFRWTLDHSSPVYNFAPVRRLGPLSAEEGYQLASEPMERLGLSYESVDIPTRIVERAGGYPSLVQFLCHQLIEQLKEDHALVFTMEHLQGAEHSPTVRDHLGGFFRFNTGPGAQLLVYRLLEADTFSLAQAHTCLEQTVGKEIPLRVIEQILLQLVLYGLVVESEDRYAWTIPLVRDTLLAGSERAYRVSQLLKDLPKDFAAWITPHDTAGGGHEGSQG